MSGIAGMLTEQIVAMLLMMMVGFALIRTHLIDDEGVAQMSKVVLYVAGPAITIRSFAVDFNTEMLVGGLACFVFAFVLTYVCVVISRYFFKPDQTLARASVIFTNVGFISIALVLTVLGPDCIIYISMFIAGNVLLTWTYGVLLVSGDKSEISFEKVITNPAVIAVGVGMILFFFSIKMPPLIEISMNALANINTGLAMVILGSYLGMTDLRSLVRDRSIYKITFIRLVVLPIICLGIIYLIPFLSTDVKLVLVIAMAAPTGAIVAMYAQLFDKDYRYAAGVVAFTTVLSVVSMPILFSLATAIL